MLHACRICKKNENGFIAEGFWAWIPLIQRWNLQIDKAGRILWDIKTKIYFQLGELYSTHLFNNLKAIKYFRQVIEVTSDPKWLYMSEEKIAEIKQIDYNIIEKQTFENTINLLSRFRSGSYCWRSCWLNSWS